MASKSTLLKTPPAWRRPHSRGASRPLVIITRWHPLPQSPGRGQVRREHPRGFGTSSRWTASNKTQSRRDGGPGIADCLTLSGRDGDASGGFRSTRRNVLGRRQPGQSQWRDASPVVPADPLTSLVTHLFRRRAPSRRALQVAAQCRPVKLLTSPPTTWRTLRVCCGEKFLKNWFRALFALKRGCNDSSYFSTMPRICEVDRSTLSTRTRRALLHPTLEIKSARMRWFKQKRRAAKKMKRQLEGCVSSQKCQRKRRSLPPRADGRLRLQQGRRPRFTTLTSVPVGTPVWVFLAKARPRALCRLPSACLFYARPAHPRACTRIRGVIGSTAWGKSMRCSDIKAGRGETPHPASPTFGAR